MATTEQRMTRAEIEAAQARSRDLGGEVTGFDAKRLLAHALAVEAQEAAEIAAWRKVTGADSPADLAAELADQRAFVRGKPSRGALSYVANKAGAERWDAQEAHRKAATAFKQKPKTAQREALLAAEARLTQAIAAERAAREALTAFERAHDLPITCRELDVAPAAQESL